MYKIIVSDEFVLCREALCELIGQSSACYDVYGVSNLKHIKNLGLAGFPDIILLDIDGIDFEKDIQNFTNQKSKIILLSHNVEAKNSYKNPNIVGLISKNRPAKYLEKAIKSILSGDGFKDFSENECQNNNAKNNRVVHLTKRENEVLRYLSKGCSNKEIAIALSIALVTVKLHVRGICKKLNVSNRTQAAILFNNKGC